MTSFLLKILRSHHVSSWLQLCARCEKEASSISDIDNKTPEWNQELFTTFKRLRDKVTCGDEVSRAGESLRMQFLMKHTFTFPEARGCTMSQETVWVASDTQTALVPESARVLTHYLPGELTQHIQVIFVELTRHFPPLSVNEMVSYCDN